MANIRTGYCDKLHDAKTGKPHRHKCIDLPPRALKLEAESERLGTMALDLIEAACKKAGVPF